MRPAFESECGAMVASEVCRPESKAVKNGGKVATCGGGGSRSGIGQRPLFFERCGSRSPVRKEPLSVAILESRPPGRTRDVVANDTASGDEVHESIFARTEREIVVFETV